MIPSPTERKKTIIENFKRSMQFTIIFICSGNIIRSPYAHFLFEHLIQNDTRLNKRILVESGGVTYRNYSISNESRDALINEGVPLEKLIKFKPRYFPDHPDMFQSADLILAMAKSHINRIPTKFGKKTFLLLEFTEGKSENIPDPYFNPPFDRAFVMIKNAVYKLRDQLLFL